MAFSKDTSAGYLVNHMARLFARALSKQINPAGMTTGAFPALLELWEGDGLTQKELRERLDIEQATVANTLTRMERDGLIRREQDEHDGRVQRIRLTPLAQAKREQAIAAAGAVNAAALSGLSSEEEAAFLATMRKVIGQLRDQND
ncbi:MarR family winged helix-turn-helix transcriptional regulator [Aurantiacibacter suaedae]|uniref:MarR family winged helix-turn-helix transcriptional regulator n=1 Tax=Aurantiacibacter suaedae TaxID=2545755 RepID=UPI0010F921B2|nr:MarR family winged helix-turn-helix transcriptional regulator [Aurantiacibacter suaedae]